MVGYVNQKETSPGVWSPVETFTTMKGNVIRQNASNRDGDKMNDDISLDHRVSLLGDAYAFDNYYNLKWIQIEGRKWEISSVEIERPRIIVSLGGLWNE